MLEIQLLMLVLGSLFGRDCLIFLLFFPCIWVMALVLNFGKMFGLVLFHFLRFFFRSFGFLLYSAIICHFYSKVNIS